MFTYCLFCRSEKCGTIAEALNRLGVCRAIYPKQVQHIRRQGVPLDLMHDMLPGYVFLYSNEELDIFALRKTPGVLKCLGDRENSFCLTGSDEQFALMLRERGGVIGKTQVYAEGDRIRLKEGSFAGVEAEILKVNRRNSRMQIQICFAGNPVRPWVEYEIVEPADNPDLLGKMQKEKAFEN